MAISIYDPQYDNGLFVYEPYTHAYFPTDHFDQVVQRNGWTFGRVGDAYVALWSQRPAEFVTHDPATTPTNGMTGPFDLVASGGPDDVWITEVGSAAVDGTFDSFVDAVDAVAAAPVSATRDAKGYSVSYRSPTAGALSTAWEKPITVGTGADAKALPVGGDLKWSSPWSTVRWGDMCATVQADGVSLNLDFSSLRPLLTDATASPAPGPCYVAPTPDPPTTTPPADPPVVTQPIPVADSRIRAAAAAEPVAGRSTYTG